MARGNLAFLAFNRGLVSALGLARADIKRLALSAEYMRNWMVRVLGAMMLRAGWQYLGATNANLKPRYVDFRFATDDCALVELTNATLRIWIEDALLTRVAVGTAVTNGSFDANIAGWTNSSEVGGAIAWVAGGYLGLTGNGSAAAKARQQVAVAAADQNKEHGLKIVIQRGEVTLRVGSSAGGDEYITETSLGTGYHSLAFTPSGASFHIEFSSRLKRQVLVDSCNVEAAGAVTLVSPWLTADLANVRGGSESTQSGDVLYMACKSYQQRKIERRGTRPFARSWSMVTYQPQNGPFRPENVGPITITPSALSGNITLAASAALFKATHVGALWKLTSSGQSVAASVTAENIFTNAIRVTGVGHARGFRVQVTGTWVGTVRLQSSTVGASGPWTDTTWSSAANADFTFTDGLDNQIVWYRLGIKTGEYTSGTASCQLTSASGSIEGVARITAFNTNQNVDAEVLVELGGTAATSFWAEGQWSDYRGWPTSGTFAEGRLCWFGLNGAWGSVSDAFESFDDSVTGDSGTINRTIGSGPVDTINFALSLARLILGAQGAELACRSTSLDEPLTPTNFNIKPVSTQGSAAVEALKIDQSGVFVQRGGTRVFELSLSGETYDYAATQLSALIPDIGKPGIVRIAAQRQPDTRIHCVRSDGTVAVVVLDKVEQVICWFELETDGLVEDAVVLPSVSGSSDDRVYYAVNRTIGGATVRYLEKWAQEDECIGGTLNKQADAFVVFTASVATTAITGLGHLEGKNAVVWANGKFLGTYPVVGAQITSLSEEIAAGAQAVVGLTYRARWKSAKLLQLLPQLAGFGLNLQKLIKGLGLIMAWVHAKGVRYGPSFEHMHDLPGIERGKPVGANEVRTAYDEATFEFDGEWSTDARLCLEANAPKPCTILAAVCEAEVHS